MILSQPVSNLSLFLLAYTLCQQLVVFNNASSVITGHYPINIKQTTKSKFPQDGAVLFDLGLRNSNCSYLLSSSLPLRVLSGCEIVNGVIKLNTVSDKLSPRTKNELVYSLIEYDERLRKDSIAVIKPRDSMKYRILEGPAAFVYFSVISTSSIFTCQSFEILFTGLLSYPIDENSLIEITFNHSIDFSSSESSDLKDFRIEEGKVSGRTKKNYMNSLLIRVKDIIAPPIAREFTLTVTIYSTNNFLLYEATRRLFVIASNIDSSEEVELTANKVICSNGTYRMNIRPSCRVISNPKYEIIPPFSLFGNQRAIIYSTSNLDRGKSIEFKLINPCSILPGDALNEGEFIVTTYEENNPAFIVHTRLDSRTSYEPGLLRNFEVIPMYRGYGYETSYTFSMVNSHFIPINGRIKIKLLSPLEFTLNPSATMNGVITSVIEDDNEISIVPSMHISPLTNINITIGVFKNPSFLNTVLQFVAYSYDDMGYKIDESGISSVFINNPGIATVTCDISNKRNLEQAEYAFTFISDSFEITENNILGIRIPIEISACSLLNDAPIDFSNTDEYYDHWIRVKNLVTETSRTSFSFKLSCRNPAVTGVTNNFELGLFEINGLKRLQGEISLEFEQGAHLNSGSFIWCDKVCPKCNSLCTLTLVRQSSTPFRTIVIINEALDLTKLTSKYDESGKDFNSMCTNISDSKETKIKITINPHRGIPIIRISDISLIYPEYPNSYPIKIRTYVTEDTKKLIDEDEVDVIVGKCTHPCQSCSESHDKCDSCLGDRYLYLEGIEGCSLLTSTNCREEESCCEGYYKVNNLCLKCNEDCKRCEGSKNNCVECMDSSKFSFQGKCRDNCDEGTYLDTTCKSCSEHCKICTSSTDCSECYDGYKFYEAEKRCVLKCPKGTYLEQTTCKVCDPNCASCYELATKCVDCNVNEYLLVAESKCIDKETCENGKQIAIGNSCEACSFDCEECKGSTTFCTKCKDSKYLNVMEGTCGSVCHPHTYPTANGECAPCENNCEMCTNSTECISCIPGMLLLTTTKTCVVSCPDKFYELNERCFQCNSPCESCDNPNSCLSCIDEHFLSKGRCFKGSCPASTFSSRTMICETCDSSCSTCETNKYSCTECAPNYYMYESQCFSSCPMGTMVIDKKCVRCNSQCQTCSGDIDSCTSCLDNEYLYKNKCWSTCPPSSTSHLSSNICVDCVAGCETCSWNTSEDLYPELCTTCLPGYLHLKSSCYSTCPEDYVSNGHSCTHISSSSNNYILLLHLIAAGVIIISMILLQLRNEKALINTNLLIILNYISISSYLILITTSPVKTNIFIVNSIVVVLQIILNIISLVVYVKSIIPDPGFSLWKTDHCCINNLVVLFSISFTFQTFRSLYSRFLGFEVMSVKFNCFNNFLDPLKILTYLQIILVQGVIIVFDLIELIRLENTTKNYTLLMESFLLSFLLILLLCYEITTIESAISDEKSQVANDRSVSNQEIINSEEKKGDNDNQDEAKINDSPLNSPRVPYENSINTERRLPPARFIDSYMECSENPLPNRDLQLKPAYSQGQQVHGRNEEGSLMLSDLKYLVQRNKSVVPLPNNDPLVAGYQSDENADYDPPTLNRDKKEREDIAEIELEVAEENDLKYPPSFQKTIAQKDKEVKVEGDVVIMNQREINDAEGARVRATIIE